MCAGFTLQLDEHQLKNILKDIQVKYAAETTVPLDSERDDLINFTQFVWLINSERQDQTFTQTNTDSIPPPIRPLILPRRW